VKVLVFVSSNKNADVVFEAIEEIYGEQVRVIHSNKSQNYRIRSVEKFDEGLNRILISTDIMARGLDITDITHVINFDTPKYPENYMHRIGRTGRAEKQGKSILFYSPREEKDKQGIERLMDYEIPTLKFPDSVEISRMLTAEERPKEKEINTAHKHKIAPPSGAAFHEKKEKNKKENSGSAARNKKVYNKSGSRKKYGGRRR